MTSSNIKYYKIQGLSRGFDCKEEFCSISCYERLLHDFFSYNKLRNTFGQLPKVALRRLRMWSKNVSAERISCLIQPHKQSSPIYAGSNRITVIVTCELIHAEQTGKIPAQILKTCKMIFKNLM